MNNDVPGQISGVRPGSLAAEAGIEPGDRLVSIAGVVPRDVVDVQFHQADAEVSVLIEKANGLQDYLVFEKDIDEDLGMEFERATWDDVILCNNNCFFCFLKGLPRGMRKSLYLKDDDYRLSFLHGNFVTLTNLTEDDWKRLETQRLSPLNVSVHATEPELRRRMLGNKTAPDICEQLRRLGSLGLRAHTQIVLCPGVNDGDNLARSLSELADLYPTVQTVSVVPVGASPRLEEWARKKDGVELVKPTRDSAREVVDILRPLQAEFRKRHGKTIAQCSDEFYVTAGVRPPGASTYDGFAQYENGIGMVRKLLDDWARTRRRIQKVGVNTRVSSVRLGCGTLIAPVLAEIGAEFESLTGIKVDVSPVPNRVFGDRVNVSGLICGEDFAEVLGRKRADLYLVPRTALDYFGRQFLDSMTVAALQERLGAPVAFATQWSEVLAAIEGRLPGPGRNAATNGAFWSEERTELPRRSTWVPA